MSRNKVVKCVETGEVFPSIKFAAKKMFGHKSNTSVCNAVKSGKPCKGLHFEVLSPNDNDMELLKGESICWVCKNTNADLCSWFNVVNPVPVRGWKATKKKLPSGGDEKIDGYIVRKCPNFAKEDWYRWEVNN